MTQDTTAHSLPSSSSTDPSYRTYSEKSMKEPEQISQTEDDAVRTEQGESSEKVQGMVDGKVVDGDGSGLPVYKEPELGALRFVLVVLSMSLGLFLSFLDTSIVATALYTIGEEFDALDTVNWVALAYTLAYVGLSVVFASLGDVYGRRNMFLSASLIFMAFSLGCGFAQTMNQLIALRAFQGIGGAGLYSLSMVIFPEICPTRYLKFVGGAVGCVVAISGVLGPVLGGIITNYTTWRWIFWINGPIGLASMISFYIFWPPASLMNPHQKRSLKQVDLLGCITLIAASALVVFAFQEGGQRPGQWTKAIFIAPIVTGCLCWILLFVWELILERNWPDSMMSIFPMRLLKTRIYLATVIVTVLSGFPYFTVIYSLPTRFQVVNGKSVLIAGISLLPMLGGSAVGSMMGGAFSSKKDNSFYVLVAGASFMVIGTALLSTLSDASTIEPKAYGYQVFVGLGFGLTVSTVSLLANIASNTRDAAVSQGIIAQMRVLGGSIGIATSTAILGITERRELAGIVTQSQLVSLKASGASLTQEQLAAIREAYCDAFNETMWVCAIVAGFCVLATCGTFKKRREEILEIRKRQFKEEMMRQRTAAAASEDKHGQTNV